VSNAFSFRSTLQAIRASLLAAVATLLRAFGRRSEPCRLNFPVLRSHQDDVGRLDEQRAQISTASLWMPPGSASAGAAAAPSRARPEVPATIERFASADGGDHRQVGATPGTLISRMHLASCG
jgi:hypothetical protein